MPTRTDEHMGFIRSFDEMMQVVQDEGFLPISRNEIPGFSLEERTMKEGWKTGKKEIDPSLWVERAIRGGDVAFGHFFVQGVGFVSEELFPYLVAYQRGNKDFADRSFDRDSIAGKVMELFGEQGEMPSYTKGEARVILGEEIGEIMVSLSHATYLCVVESREEYLYCTPEYLWGRSYVTSKYGESDPFSFIVKKVQENYPAATPEMVQGLMGKCFASLEGSPLEKKAEEMVPEKKEGGIFLKRGRLYPNNLVEDVFDIYQAEDVTYPENCLLALEDAIKKLGSRQADILRMRYQENQVYDSIANSFGISKERVRQIIKRAIQQLQTPLMKEAFGPLLEGGKSRQEMKRLSKSSPQRTKKTIEMYVRRFEVPAAESLAHQELLKNYELSSRCVKCLQRHGYTSVGQVLWLYKKDPDFESLHNFGTKSKAEIMDLLGRLQLLSDGK